MHNFNVEFKGWPISGESKYIETPFKPGVWVLLE